MADSVADNRDAIEAWAESDLPLAEDMKALLETASAEANGV